MMIYSLIIHLFTICYILCMFSGTNTIPKKETLHLYKKLKSHASCLMSSLIISYKGFYFILLNIFSYVYFREMGKNKWWFKSLILYFFTNCYLLCMFIGTKPFFENTNITKNKPTTIPADCLVWWISNNRAITLLNVAMDDLPLQVVRPA